MLTETWKVACPEGFSELPGRQLTASSAASHLFSVSELPGRQLTQEAGLLGAAGLSELPGRQLTCRFFVCSGFSFLSCLGGS